MNILKKIAVLGAMSVMTTALFTGCGMDIEGEWKLTEMEMEGESYDIKELEEQFGEELDFSIEFTEDEVIVNSMGEEEKFDYEIDGDELVIDDEDVDIVYDEDDDTITLKEGSEKMVFERK